LTEPFYVGRFQITMRDALLVFRFEAVGDLLRKHNVGPDSIQSLSGSMPGPAWCRAFGRQFFAGL